MVLINTQIGWTVIKYSCFVDCVSSFTSFLSSLTFKPAAGDTFSKLSLSNEVEY
jgi:hypothetical protein